MPVCWLGTGRWSWCRSLRLLSPKTILQCWWCGKSEGLQWKRRNRPWETIRARCNKRFCVSAEERRFSTGKCALIRDGDSQRGTFSSTWALQWMSSLLIHWKVAWVWNCVRFWYCLQIYVATYFAGADVSRNGFSCQFVDSQDWPQEPAQRGDWTDRKLEGKMELNSLWISEESTIGSKMSVGAREDCFNY